MTKTNKITKINMKRIKIHNLNVGHYMGGFALMVISQKNWEFWTFFMSTLCIIQPHLKSFNDFISTYR